MLFPKCLTIFWYPFHFVKGTPRLLLWMNDTAPSADDAIYRPWIYISVLCCAVCHPLRGASYRDPGTMISEQGSGCRSLCGALHLRPGVVKNKQGSSHFSRRVRRVRKLAEPTRIRLGSWNIGSLIGKLRELVDVAIRRRVNILCVQETKWKGQKAKEVEGSGFKLWYTGIT
jgi:hypothetical protein